MDKKWVRFVGKILMVFSLVFIVRTVWQNRESIQAALNGRCLPLMMLYAIVMALSVTLNGYLFSKLIGAIEGKACRTRRTIYLYSVANLYKYMPGNIMHYVGRNRIATEGLAGYESVNIASVIEIIESVVAFSVLGISLAFPYVTDYIAGIVNKKIIAAVISGFICCCAVLMFVASRSAKLKSLFQMIFAKRVIKTVALIIGVYIVTGLFTNSFVFFFIRELGGDVGAEMFFPTVGMYVIAWLIGFAVPGAPGGIGVREACMSIFLKGVVPIGIITCTALLLRVSQICGELLACAFGLCIQDRPKA